MIKLERKRPAITPLKAGLIAVFVILLWLGFQIVLPLMLETVYFRFLLLCILGFGFMVISYILKYS